MVIGLLAAALVSVAVQAPAPPPDRIARVEYWLKAVLHHRPGTVDEPAAEIADWSPDQLATLWIDLRSLTLLMRNPKLQNLRADTGQRGRQAAVYEPRQERRLAELACAAAGIVRSDPTCVRRALHLDAELLELDARALAARGVGADNFVLKYGALLHTDIATLAPERTVPVSRRPNAVQRFRVDMADGQPTNMYDVGVHWEIGRMLLDAVRPSRGDRVAPARDPMVRDWYRATSAWMQYEVHYELAHVARAVALFPDDPMILFLCGTQHEAYATPRVQAVARAVTAPPGMFIDPQSDGYELREAQALLRRAVAADPDFAEARLRLGRVLALRSEFADAERELTRSLDGLDDPTNQYYARLFLGAVQVATRQDGAARASFVRAADLFPEAQSPWLALAALARRGGDRVAALRSMQTVFALTPDADARPDPWWRYDVWQARKADDMLDALREQFASEAPQ